MKNISSILFFLCALWGCAAAQSLPTPTDDRGWRISPYVFHSGQTYFTDTAYSRPVTMIANIGQNVIGLTIDKDNDTLVQGFWYMWGELLHKPALPPIVLTQDTLYPNYPNPFTPMTTIPFYLSPNIHGSRSIRVQLLIYTVNGQLIATLINGYVTVGEHTVTISNPYSIFHYSGVYLCTMIVDDPNGPTPMREELSMKMMFVR